MFDRVLNISLSFLDLKHFSILGFWRMFFKTGRRDRRSCGREGFVQGLGVKQCDASKRMAA